MGLGRADTVSGARLPASHSALLRQREFGGQFHQSVQGLLAIGCKQGRRLRRLTRFDPYADFGEDLAITLSGAIERLHQHQRVRLGDPLLQLGGQPVHGRRFGIQRRVDDLALVA